MASVEGRQRGCDQRARLLQQSRGMRRTDSTGVPGEGSGTFEGPREGYEAGGQREVSGVRRGSQFEFKYDESNRNSLLFPPCKLVLFLIFLTTPHNLWDLRSPTRVESGPIAMKAES